MKWLEEDSGGPCYYSCCFSPRWNKVRSLCFELLRGHVCRAEYWRIFLLATRGPLQNTSQLLFLLSAKWRLTRRIFNFNHWRVWTKHCSLMSWRFFTTGVCLFVRQQHTSTQTELLSTLNESRQIQKRKCFLICNATWKIRGEKRLLVLDSISILLSRQWVVERLSPKTAARPYSEPFSASYWSGRFSKEGW